MVNLSSKRSDLLRLSQGRWFVPLLANIGDNGARSSELRRSLELSASMLQRSLGQMQIEGWIVPNPGHGHPLRPEWIATEMGEKLVVNCRAIMNERRSLGLSVEGYGRWHLPLIVELAAKEKRFGEIHQALTPVSPRALSQALKRGVAMGQVRRRLEDDYPPTPFYRIAEKVRPLAQVAMALK